MRASCWVQQAYSYHPSPAHLLADVQPVRGERVEGDDWEVNGLQTASTGKGDGDPPLLTLRLVFPRV